MNTRVRKLNTFYFCNVIMLEDKFLQIFISDKNSGYLFNLIISKIINVYPNFEHNIMNNIHQYKSNLIDIQKFIFKDYFYNLYNTNSNNDLENILISLNQITVKTFENILLQNLQNLPQPTNSLHVNGHVNEHVNEHVNGHVNEHVNDQVNKQVKVNNNFDDLGNNDINFTLKHFLSEDADFKFGRYYYKYFLKNVRSLSLHSIKITCNIYNINEYNNKFYILYENTRKLINIPIGYYSISNLLQCLNRLINSTENKNSNLQIEETVEVYKDNIKNKIIFASTTSQQFGIHFIPNNPNIYNNYTLQEILGFKNTEYINNSYYISERHPINNIYDDLYLKIFINDKELHKYNTTRDNFSYYEIVSIDMDKSFGKSITYKPHIDPYDIYENININTISFQFNNNYKYYLNTPIEFNIILGFEYL